MTRTQPRGRRLAALITFDDLKPYRGKSKLCPGCGSPNVLNACVDCGHHFHNKDARRAAKKEGGLDLKLLKRVGAYLAATGVMPGYGDIFYKENGDVYYVGGDSDTKEFIERVEKTLRKVPGVKEIQIESESHPSEEDGWIQVFPEKKKASTKPSKKLDMSPSKACKILHDGEVHGHPLSDAQRGMFGAKCGESRKSAVDSDEEERAQAGLEWAERQLELEKSADVPGVEALRSLTEQVEEARERLQAVKRKASRARRAVHPEETKYTCELCGNLCTEFGDIDGAIVCNECMGFTGKEPKPEVKQFYLKHGLNERGEEPEIPDKEPIWPPTTKMPGKRESYLHEEPCPPCPSCGAKALHVRSLNGNAQCTECAQIFKDPGYGRGKIKSSTKPVLECPKCGGRATHMRTDGRGNAGCAECGLIFTDPNYGKKQNHANPSHLRST